ncbi:MAG: response regulator [Anaerolineae bacterium]|nr:response regulator [Anaerolineae bacterium]
MMNEQVDLENTQVQQLQLSLARYAQQVRISTEVAQEIADAPALDELYRRVVTLVKERFGYYHVQVFRLDPKLKAMVVAEGYGQVGEKMKAAGHSLPYGRGIVGTVAATGQPVLASDVSQDPHWVTSSYLPNTKGELVVPIKLRDSVLGVLDVQSDVAGALTEEDQVLLLGLAGQIAVAIQNTNLLEQSQAMLAKARESEQMLRTVIDATPDWIFIKDQEHRYRLVNRGYAKSLGLDPEDFGGKNDLDLGFSEAQVRGDPEKGIQGFWAHDRSVMESGETRTYRGDPVMVDGEAHYFHSIKAPMRDTEGRIWGVLGFSRDITEREQLLAEVQQSEELLRTLIDATPDWIFIKDQEHRYRLVNQGYANALHLSPEDFIGKNDLELGFPEELVKGNPEKGIRGFWADDRLVMDSGERQIYPRDPATIDGQVHVFHTIKVPLRNAQGDVWGVLAFARDVSEREELMAELEHRATQLQAAAEVSRVAREEAEKAKEKAEAASQALTARMWQTAGQAQLSDRMRGEQNMSTLADNVMQQLCRYLPAQVGMLYTAQLGPEYPSGGVLTLMGGYAYPSRGGRSVRFNLGEGLVGQAALERQSITLSDVPEGYLPITSGLGQATPRHIFISPFLYDDQVAGVVELGTLAEFSPAQIEFLQTALTNIGIAFTTARARAQIDELLSKTQQQAEELQAQSEELQTQSEELRVANEELQSQTDSLRRSEAALREKQFELESANAELEEHTTALQEKQAVLDRQNHDLSVAQAELGRKAEELALASKYKSEFLANMSHELRTPLNSLLILAGMLQQNEAGNLTADQVESLQVIHTSGRDLLELINDILDLSKIEAGRMTFRFEPTVLGDIVEAMVAQFAHVAEDKGLIFETILAEDLPATIETDRQRIQQILKNLLSNACKFTERGRVGLDVRRASALPERFAAESGLEPDRVVAFSVTDTGIGIAPEEQKIVFEAFRQVEGGTSRKYGGTGLGLSISRELSLQLGGYLALQSEPEKGSTFILYVPQERRSAETGRIAGPERMASSPTAAEPPRPSSPPDRMESLARSSTAQALTLIPDDRDDLESGAKTLLVIEDDVEFARIVRDFARKKGFKCLVAGDGETGLALAGRYRPDAIMLDLHLPRLNGWEVLARLKDGSDTRHIPVHIMSVDSETLDAYKHGAMGFLTKPLSAQELESAFQQIESFIERSVKTLLLVEDDASLRLSITKLLGGGDVRISEADSGQAALDLLRAQQFDCMILDLSLPDLSGFEVLNRMNEEETTTKCPVIVYTGRDLTPEENQDLMRYADSVIVKGVKSPERLLDETALFLHRVVADLPEEKQQTIRRLHDKEAQLVGKRILIVDDDARSAFALSKLLADKGLAVSIARDGQQALDLLAKTPGMDLVLMDVMMPVMDGYETMRRIRAQRQFETLPILALTAKAMVDDRDKCLAAGANDYLTKPIDPARLFSVLRVWLYR